MNGLITDLFYIICRHDYSGYSYTNVSCSKHDNYKDYGQLHLLRCQGNIQQQKCSQYPVELQCGQ